MPHGATPWFSCRPQSRPSLGARFAGGLALGLTLLTGCSTTTAPTPRASEVRVEPGTYLPDFDAAWELVRDTFHEETYNGVDWEGVRAELRPRAEAATTRDASRDIINEMVGRLNQSHFGVIPQELQETGGDDPDPSGQVASGSDAEDGGVGLELSVVGSQAVITRVQPDGPAAQAGVRPGWVLTAVRGNEVAPLIGRFNESIGDRTGRLYARQTIATRLLGPVGSSIELGFLDGADREVTRTIERAPPEGQMIKFGNLPPMNVRIESRWLGPDETGDGSARIGYIAFNSFMIPITPAFERAMVEFRDADGIILDLRGNLGGVAGMSASLSRFFVTERSRIGTILMRGQTLELNADPIVVTARGDLLGPYAGPLAVLIDESSASTSEFMAGGLRGLGRARTFGTRTAGMALPAAMSALPSGDVLLHAMADYVSSDGTRLESTGVPADVEIPVDRDGLLRGIDAPVRAAAEWIAGATPDA